MRDGNAAETNAPLDERGVLLGSGLLLIARAGQAVAGILALAATTRTLGPRDFGDFATFLALGTLAGGVAQAALSDAAVASEKGGDAMHRLERGLRPIAGIAVVAALILAGASRSAAAALAVVALTTISAITAPAIARARHAGRAGTIAMAQIAGACATAVCAGVLWQTDSKEWPLFLIAYALQPAALLFVDRSHIAVARVDTLRDELRVVWGASRHYLVSQAAWLTIGPCPILALRIVEGATVAGKYAAMARIVDVLAIVGPLMGTLVLPAMVESARAGHDPLARQRLNVLAASATTAVFAIGVPWGWLGWRVLYGDVAFPVTAFAIIAVGYGINGATGLPDRLLQATGRADVVARTATVTAVVLAVLAVVLSMARGLSGAATASAAAWAGVGTFLLARGRPTRSAAAMHVTLALVAATVAVVGAATEGSVWPSIALSAGAALAVSAIWSRARAVLGPPMAARDVT